MSGRHCATCACTSDTCPDCGQDVKYDGHAFGYGYDCPRAALTKACNKAERIGSEVAAELGIALPLRWDEPRAEEFDAACAQREIA